VTEEMGSYLRILPLRIFSFHLYIYTQISKPKQRVIRHYMLSHSKGALFETLTQPKKGSTLGLTLGFPGVGCEPHAWLIVVFN